MTPGIRFRKEAQADQAGLPSERETQEFAKQQINGLINEESIRIVNEQNFNELNMQSNMWCVLMLGLLPNCVLDIRLNDKVCKNLKKTQTFYLK